MKSLLLLALLALLLAGCSTSYKPRGFRGGFTERQTETNRWYIVFNGNAYTSEQQVQDFCLLRAAEVSLAAGFPYFRVIQNNAARECKQVQMSAGEATTTGTVQSYRQPYSPTITAQYQEHTTYSPPQFMTMNKAILGVLIEGCAEGSDAPPRTLNARLLADSIRKTYGIKDRQ